jgi:hypothetical protein
MFLADKHLQDWCLMKVTLTHANLQFKYKFAMLFSVIDRKVNFDLAADYLI